jgi:hypothetical protein
MAKRKGKKQLKGGKKLKQTKTLSMTRSVVPMDIPGESLDDPYKSRIHAD